MPPLRRLFAAVFASAGLLAGLAGAQPPAAPVKPAKVEPSQPTAGGRFPTDPGAPAANAPAGNAPPANAPLAKPPAQALFDSLSRVLADRYAQQLGGEG